MHVGLIFPFMAEMVRVDLAGQDYDHILREPKPRTVSGKRDDGRREQEPVRIKVQIEDDVFRGLNMMNAGNSPESQMGIVGDMRWLRQNGFVDEATGLVKFKPGDRLNAIYTMRGDLVHLVKNPPGLFVTEVRPISYGLCGRQNLCLILFGDRAQARNG